MKPGMWQNTRLNPNGRYIGSASVDTLIKLFEQSRVHVVSKLKQMMLPEGRDGPVRPLLRFVLVELVELQDREVGDGTTSVVIIAAKLLKRANDLVRNKIHPTSVISGYRLAMRESCKYIEDKLGVKVDKLGKETLVNCAKTSMSSKKKLRRFSSKFREKYLTTSKDIEEGPITVAPQETIKKLEQAARRLAKSVNYVGATNVEYLYSMETGDYYFLELNPRLQVEHRVTKWIAKINLPAAQVAVGMGIPLWQIPEIRRFYGMDNSGGYDAWRATLVNTTPFDLKIEIYHAKSQLCCCNLTMWIPMKELSFESKPNVWAYFSVKSIALAFGESRTLAIANMVLGLKEIQIRDEIRTNVDYTIDLLHKAAAGSAAMVSDYVGYLERVRFLLSIYTLNIEAIASSTITPVMPRPEPVLQTTFQYTLAPAPMASVPPTISGQ
ncbi:acetyl-CoA carboxylase 1 [Tanacetum coccineum]